MNFREAESNDIKKIQIVRSAVKENVLSNPNLFTEDDYKAYLSEKGKTWVCEIKNDIVGFATVDTSNNNVWALFVKPEFEDQGIGKQLHNMMLNWYFKQTKTPVWLGTAPKTRAEKFYKLSGWENLGSLENGETKFEMTYDQWQNS